MAHPARLGVRRRIGYDNEEDVIDSYLEDLYTLIDRWCHQQVTDLAARASQAMWLSETERASALGEEITELFTKPVPLISSPAELQPAARLVRAYFDRIDTTELGAHYLRAATEQETNQ